MNISLHLSWRYLTLETLTYSLTFSWSMLQTRLKSVSGQDWINLPNKVYAPALPPFGSIIVMHTTPSAGWPIPWALAVVQAMYDRFFLRLWMLVWDTPLLSPWWLSISVSVARCVYRESIDSWRLFAFQITFAQQRVLVHSPYTSGLLLCHRGWSHPSTLGQPHLPNMVMSDC